MSFSSLSPTGPSSVSSSSSEQPQNSLRETRSSMQDEKTCEELDPCLMQERDTRSGRFILDPIEICGYKSGIVELTLSQGQEEKLQQETIKAMASQGHYAIARRHTTQVGSARDISSLKWIREAIKSSADIIRPRHIDSDRYAIDNTIPEKERSLAIEAMKKAQDKSIADQDRATDYDNHRRAITKTIEEKERSYRLAIEAMKKALRKESFNLEGLFENFHIAISLNPHIFEPYSSVLVIAPFMIRPGSQLAEEMESIVNDAYAHSPIQTFNILMSYFLARPHSQDFSSFFFKRFPKDVLGYIANNQRSEHIEADRQAQEKDFREAFSTHLANGLNAIRKTDYQQARDEFVKASCYHISDKRAYIYQALIDLEAGDVLSAVKLRTILTHLVNWTNRAERESAIRRWVSQLIPKETQAQREEIQNPTQCPELPVLKALIKMYNSNETNAGHEFLKEMKSYLQNSPPDLIWMDFAINLAKTRINDLGLLTNLHSLIPYVSYDHLARRSTDLSDYQDQISIKEDRSVWITPSLIICETDVEPPPITINSESFQMVVDENTFFHQILQDSLNKFSLVFTRYIDLDNFLEALTNLKAENIPLHCPTLVIFLERLSEEGMWEQRIRLLTWTCQNRSILTNPLSQILSDAFSRWQLSQPILPQKEANELNLFRESIANAKIETTLSDTFSRWQLSKTILTKKETDQSNSIETALVAWSSLMNNNRSEAGRVIQNFFAEWKNSPPERIDFIALRTLCTVRTLLQKEGLANTMPRLASSNFHAELIECALSILAREGRPYLYVVPKQANSEYETRELLYLYVGQQRGESDEIYLLRLKKNLPPHPSDLRAAKYVNLNKNTPDDGSWVFPFVQSSVLIKQVNQFLQKEIGLQKARCLKNEKTKKESPQYPVSNEFISWFDKQKNLISEYSADPKNVCTDLDTTVPNFSGRKQFLEELESKVKHAENFKKLRENTALPSNKPGERFWQLVSQAATLVETIYSNKRDEENYDMVVCNEEEARFVTQLFYEWSRAARRRHLKTLPDQKFVEAFHGPETHIWGRGPRIPHFNAGIYLNETLVNVHIFIASN